jgi:hypothetical protein
MQNVLKAFFRSIKNNQIFTGQNNQIFTGKNENKYALAEELIKDFICKESERHAILT